MPLKRSVIFGSNSFYNVYKTFDLVFVNSVIVVPDGIEYWMDSTLYEIFILPNVTGNFKDLLFIITEEFQRSRDDSNYYYLTDITFHLYPSDNPYFYFENSDITNVIFEDLYGLYIPDVIEMTSLSPATSDPIPLDDYELQVAVSVQGNELLRRDIIIHVVSLERPPSVPGNSSFPLHIACTVEFPG